MVRSDELVRNIDLKISSLAFVVVAMQCQVAAMTSGYDLQAAVLNRGVHNRGPNRDHGGRIGFRIHDSHILVPAHSRRQPIQQFLGDVLFRCLDADVLDRVRVDFTADKILQHIKNARIAQKIEHCRAEMNGRVSGTVRRQD